MLLLWRPRVTLSERKYFGIANNFGCKGVERRVRQTEYPYYHHLLSNLCSVMWISCKLLFSLTNFYPSSIFHLMMYVFPEGVLSIHRNLLFSVLNQVLLLHTERNVAKKKR